MLYRNSFRIIVAGGGTGTVTVFSGEQLNHTNGEVIYLDFSASSMQISQRRARSRGIQNILWIRSWIEGARYLGMGLFHELQCSGVLHHLKNPSFGLKILKDNLLENGGLGLMVYAKYGRTYIYHIQQLMKMINSNQDEIQVEIKNTNSIMNVLPDYNWLTINPTAIRRGHNDGDIGIYDLFLHKRDIAFSIQTLFEWIKMCGLHFVDFDNINRRFGINLKYRIRDNYLKRKTSILDSIKQFSIVDLFRGSIVKYDFYASKTKNSVADLEDTSNILYMYGNPHGFREALENVRNIKTVGNQSFFFARLSQIYLIQTFKKTFELEYYSMAYDKQGAISNTIVFSFKWNHFNHFLINRLMDSNKGVDLKSLYHEYSDSLNYSIGVNELMGNTKDFYDSVKDTEMFLLKTRSVYPFPKTSFGSFFKINPI